MRILEVHVTTRKDNLFIKIDVDRLINTPFVFDRRFEGGVTLILARGRLGAPISVQCF